MSKRIIYKCDRCGREVPPKDYVLAIELYLIRIGSRERLAPIKEPQPLHGRLTQIRRFDFCSACADEILSWFPKVPEDPEGG